MIFSETPWSSKIDYSKNSEGKRKIDHLKRIRFKKFFKFISKLSILAQNMHLYRNHSGALFKIQTILFETILHWIVNQNGALKNAEINFFSLFTETDKQKFLFQIKWLTKLHQCYPVRLDLWRWRGFKNFLIGVCFRNLGPKWSNLRQLLPNNLISPRCRNGGVVLFSGIWPFCVKK